MAADERSGLTRLLAGPGWALLTLLLPAGLRAEITGDLRERFAARVRRDGELRTLTWFYGQVLRIRPLKLRRAAAVAIRRHEAKGSVTTMGIMTGWWGDVRQAARSLRSRFGLAATVVVTVALAVGVTTSVFSVVNGVLLRPLDYPESDRLVRAWQTEPDWMEHPNPQLRAFSTRFPLSVPTFNDWHAARTGFQASGIYSDASWVHQTAEGAEIVNGMHLTSGVLEALGVEPMMGRLPTPEDDAIGAPAVAVLSYGEWRDRFGGDPQIVGRSVSLDGQPHTVIGVMPEGFRVMDSGSGVWASMEESQKTDGRDSQGFTVLGRLRPGASIESVTEELLSIQAGLTEAYPDEQGDRGARVVGLLDSMVGDVRSTLFFLLAAVGLVLLIACVNIANMLSVSGLARRREMAVKSALGASRAQLARSLLTESAVLAVMGGVGGIALAVLSLPVLTRILPASLPRVDAIHADPRVLAFGCVVTAATALVVGVLPALQAARTEPKQMMDSTSRGLAGGKAGERLRATLVVTEVALAFVLLVGAALLATSFTRLWNVERGFSTEGLIAMRVSPGVVEAEYPSDEDRERFAQALQERLSAIPGTRVSRTNQIPLSGSTSSTTYYIDQDGAEQIEATVMISVIGDDYLDVMGIALLEGRTFDGTEVRDGPPVAVANRALIERYWPGESGLGKELRADEDAPPTAIIGVAADVRGQSLAEDGEPRLYVSARQNHRWGGQWVIRAEGDPAAVIELARAAVAEVSPSTPVRDIEILEERIARSVAVPRFRTFFVVGLAVLATVLALLGVYGVVTFAVSQRTRELAVRMAIGAHPREVVRGTLGRGFRLSVGGVAVGLLIAWQGGRLLEEFLFEVEPVDPLVYGLVAVLVGVVSVLASYVPARRASRVDPVSVLNAE